MKKILRIAALSLSASAAMLGSANAQVAGSTARSVTLTEVQDLTLGWSVKKTLLGKAVYNSRGERIGSVVDLIISPDKSVSYLIIGAGGFIGVGRHDVAVSVAQVKDERGKWVMDGVTKDSIKAMPAFEYATDERRRAQIAAQADRDISLAQAKLAELDKQASAATAEAKIQINDHKVELRQDLEAAEAKLVELRKASAAKWKLFEADVSAAIDKLRKSINAATR